MNNITSLHYGSKLLLVDDNLTNVKVLFDYLTKAGFRVLVAQNGEDALSVVKENPPDLILLDILMPGIDGFETLKRLKTTEEAENIPVILLSALSDSVDKVKGFKAGAVDFITKPIDQDEALARIETHLNIQFLKSRLEEKNKALEREIAERKKVEQALVDSECQLKEAIGVKDKFFSIIAHDLKTPFNSLLGYSELLLDYYNDYNDERRMEFIRNINSASVNMFKLLENLLEWARMQSGRVVYNPVRMHIQPVIIEAVAAHDGNARNKNISMNINIDPELSIITDINMFMMLVRNLVSNAIKYTERNGKITITSRDLEELVEISVKDNGIGISREKQDKLFRIEYHCSSLGTDEERGTGLGLILCKEFVENSGGTIFVESEPGTGSCFRFTLPKENPAIKFNALECL